MDETYGAYVDDECCDIHDYDDGTDHDTDDDTNDDDTDGDTVKLRSVQLSCVRLA